MFRVLGESASRYSPVVLIAWVACLIAILWSTPKFNEVVNDGEFRYIPDAGRMWPWQAKKKFSSREGEHLFQRSFTRDLLGSSVVLVLRRESDGGLRDEDHRFVQNVLLPRLKIYEATRQELEQQLRDGLDELRASGKVAAGIPVTQRAGLQRLHNDVLPVRTDDPAQIVKLKKRMRRVAGELLRRHVLHDESNDPRPFDPLVINIRTADDEGIGELLHSEDGKATLVILELRTEFLETRNRALLDRIEALISRDGELRNPPDNGRVPAGAAREREAIPVGLDIALSGTATVGRDMRLAQEQSADNTEAATLVLVFVLLLLIYRSPLLVLVPLLTVFVSLTIALQVLAFLASCGPVAIGDWTFQIELFSGIEIYVTVVMYGAGVDYCMFLMARYKEELDGGAAIPDAIATAVRKVGSALAASAGTTMAGIGMMVCAQFGKFQQAGVAMSFSLVFVLAASLTFAPALLRLFGRWAFWPQMRSEGLPQAAGWVSPTRLIDRLLQTGIFRGLWENIGRKLRARPGTIWLASVAVMAPFAVIALLNHGFLSFGLLSELPADAPSVVGTRAVQEHFPAGATGPATILLKTRDLVFEKEGVATDEGLRYIARVTEDLQNRREELGISDVRSLAKPFGDSEAARRAEAKWDAELGKLSGLERIARNRNRRKEEVAYYVSDKGKLAGHVTRIDIVFQKDPFSRHMIDRLEETKRTVRELLPVEHRRDTELFVIGSTASIADLKAVTGQDQVRIDVLVVLSVFAVLVILLRRPAISGYLIVSVFFSYLVTLGATYSLFWALDPSGFAGLDWKVPVFLFTILIAVGEDYNIYLVTRIEEEQASHGQLDGITTALTKTGSIISGCGIIMAGTFSSLLFGTLTGMHQLGFALAFGVLLDTFVVRPVLVPAYLMLLYSGRFGALGRLLGAHARVHSGAQPPLHVGRDGPSRP